MIKRNPPTAIVTIMNREALLYAEKAPITQTAPKCYQYLIEKYSRLLHIDKINRRDGIPTDSYTGSYDPINKEIVVIKGEPILVKSAKRFPYMKM
ncbi:hypothetical protein [Spirosoma endbachense]|uniref:Uncharacterized protein n=1 Tax=Spirosoma endbachense TaxID=2666025 RepID=A0A6P1VNL9_9BACT|nr:hypothetical protein [Spirosoma endbachense]QHV94018.1 hypothetical protein GJR95_02795 [Spirosoma endbachense]